MATTKGIIQDWLSRKELPQAWYQAKKAGKKVTHLLVVWDTFDLDDGDYPVYVVQGENVQKAIDEHS